MGQGERSGRQGRLDGDTERGWEDEMEGQGGRMSTREERERVGQESSEVEAGQIHLGSNLHCESLAGEVTNPSNFTLFNVKWDTTTYFRELLGRFNKIKVKHSPG